MTEQRPENKTEQPQAEAMGLLSDPAEHEL